MFDKPVRIPQIATAATAGQFLEGANRCSQRRLYHSKRGQRDCGVEFLVVDGRACATLPIGALCSPRERTVAEKGRVPNFEAKYLRRLPHPSLSSRLWFIKAALLPIWTLHSNFISQSSLSPHHLFTANSHAPTRTGVALASRPCHIFYAFNLLLGLASISRWPTAQLLAARSRGLCPSASRHRYRLANPS